MKKTITMTAYRRPEYTRQVLASLAACEGVEDWLFLPHVDEGCEETADVVFNFCNSAKFECRPTFNAKRLGLNRNSRKALNAAVMAMTKFNAHIEDDTLLAKDFLAWMEFGRQAYQLDESVFSIAGYNKADRHFFKNKRPVAADYHRAFRRDWFTCWGWGTWRKNLKFILESWSTDNPKSFAWNINDVSRGGKDEIHPGLSRVQNIGYEKGENGRSPRWYRTNHRTGIFADDFPFSQPAEFLAATELQEIE